MSYAAIAWALEQHQLPQGQQITLVRLANRMNKCTGRCDPSVARLAAESRTSERTVQRNLAGLHRAGLVTIRSRAGRRSDFVLHVGRAPAATVPLAAAAAPQAADPDHLLLRYLAEADTVGLPPIWLSVRHDPEAAESYLAGLRAAAERAPDLVELAELLALVEADGAEPVEEEAVRIPVIVISQSG